MPVGRTRPEKRREWHAQLLGDLRQPTRSDAVEGRSHSSGPAGTRPRSRSQARCARGAPSGAPAPLGGAVPRRQALLWTERKEIIFRAVALVPGPLVSSSSNSLSFAHNVACAVPGGRAARSGPGSPCRKPRRDCELVVLAPQEFAAVLSPGRFRQLYSAMAFSTNRAQYDEPIGKISSLKS